MVPEREFSQWSQNGSPVSGPRTGVQSVVPERESSQWSQNGSPVSGPRMGVQSVVPEIGVCGSSMFLATPR